MINLKDFLEEIGEPPKGYKGQFFLGYDLLENQDILKKFRNLSLEDTFSLLKLYNHYESKHIINEFKEFENLIIDNVKLTNIETKGFSSQDLGIKNAKYVANKNPHILIPYLYLSDKKFRDEHILFENYQVLENCLNEGRGAVLSIFHWGMFQNFIPILISRKVKVTFIANYYALMFLQGLIVSYIPEYADYINYIPTGDPTLIKQCVNKLKHNEFIALLPELSLGLDKQEEVVDFLGTSVYVPQGSAALTMLAGSILVPCYIEESEVNGDLKYITRFMEPIQPTTYDKKHIIELSQILFKLLETQIPQRPHYWCGWEILHRMIKNT